MIIDTTYNSLAEIDNEVVRFYSEDARKRVLGYTEEEPIEPIYEEYIVIVLNQPDEVPYSNVDQRRGERKPWIPTVKVELERAIAWEDFDVNHNQYLQWLEDLAKWEEEQPTEPVWDEELQEYVETLIPAPERPVINPTVRQEYYDEVYVDVDETLAYVHEGASTVYDDELLIKTITPNHTPKTEEEIKAWEVENYISLRKVAYGTWEEQMEMQYDGTWEAHVLAVKQRYPKE